MLPSIFGERLFDDVLGEGFPLSGAFAKHPLFGRHARHVMKTDVRELEDAYELDVDLPGFKKEGVKVEVDDGYLTISAEKSSAHDEQDSQGQYIRRERCSGGCSRSFYIGAGLEARDVKAKFEDGILRLSFPKSPQAKEPEQKLVEIA